MECPAQLSSLCQLARGQCAVIEAFQSHRTDQRQLEAMGLCIGQLVTMLMPGSPSAVAVGETRLMVSHELLSTVVVSPLE